MSLPSYRHLPPRCIIVMGVSGSGKSSVASQLATKMNAVFIDGDDLHPASNITKMANGVPLTDDDRTPWLNRICQQANAQMADMSDVIVVCSALKRSYRDIFRQHLPHLTFLFLDGSYTVIEQRMHARQNHFMKAGMLQSQFATLERPDSMENDVITLSVEASISDIVEQAYQLLPSVSE